MNPVSYEPVVLQLVATIIVYLGAKFSMEMTDAQAAMAAGAVLTILTPFVRQLVTPQAKLDGEVVDGVEDEHPAPVVQKPEEPARVTRREL
jgi:hypothetical protein